MRKKQNSLLQPLFAVGKSAVWRNNMGKMIIVASGKGGTGKTTFTSQIGMWLSSLGYLTVLVDADAGFRNLDIALGLESSVVYDYSDFMSGTSDLDDILTKSHNSENLYFIAAPQSAKTSDFDTERVKLFWDSVKSRFDFVIADAPAGMGDGFMFAAEFADEAIIVSLAETPSLRDADRVIENLENKGIETIRLVLNRVNPEQIASRVQINVDDCIDVLSIPILGIVPEDIKVAESAAKGISVTPDIQGAGQAFLNIARRLAGKSIPMMEFRRPSRKSIWSRMRKSLNKSQ